MYRNIYTHFRILYLILVTLSTISKTGTNFSEKTENNKYWQGCGEFGTLVHCWWEYKMMQSLWKTVWKFLKKLKIELPCDPVIPLLGIYPKELKTESQRDICTLMFIE